MTALGVAAGSLIAVCATPAGVATIDYYHGLLTNVAAQQGVGQWAPLGQSPFDWVMLAVLLAFVLRLRRRLPALWELAVIIGLSLLTIKAARDGVWLLFFLVAPASRARQGQAKWEALAPVLAILGVLLLLIDVAKVPHPSGASRLMVTRAVRLAHGTPILADGLPAEQVAASGGRIWAGNPLDAFSHRVQTEYVGFLSDRPAGRQALSAPGVRVVLVTRGSSAAAMAAGDPHYSVVASDATAVILARTR